jgi:hypothetical protein
LLQVAAKLLEERRPDFGRSGMGKNPDCVNIIRT